jgi:hypothetical protein
VHLHCTHSGCVRICTVSSSSIGQYCTHSTVLPNSAHPPLHLLQAESIYADEDGEDDSDVEEGEGEEDEDLEAEEEDPARKKQKQ